MSDAEVNLFPAQVDVVQAIQALPDVQSSGVYVESLPFCMVSVRVLFAGRLPSNWATIVLDSDGTPVSSSYDKASVALLAAIRDSRRRAADAAQSSKSEAATSPGINT